jgi:DNA-binding transcriptional MocR family regulator
MAYLLEQGKLQDHIAYTLQPAYAKRYHLIMSAIEKHLVPLGVLLPQTGREVVGGYFIWLRLPKGVKAQDVARRAKEAENMIVPEGALFEVPGDAENANTSFPYDIRLCFAWEEEEQLTEAVERLARVIRALQDSESIDAKVTNEAGGDTERSRNRKDDQSAFW